MASNAISAQGTGITLGGVAVSEITSWSGLGVSADTTEVTNIDSPDNFEEHIKTLLRGDEITLEMNYAKTSYGAMNTLVEDFDSTTFVLTTVETVPTVFTIPVFVTSNKMSGSSGDKVSASVSLKVTGKIVIT